jgi:3-isopropylmalate/(R)-2-methylmalate dehydratase small subunit
MKLSGKAWKLGADIDTDVIIAGRHCSSTDPKHLAAHCLENIDPEFASKVRPGDMLFAGRNFGCGSSRELAPMALKATGISAVVAESFGRIFFRNAVNIGFPVLECREAAIGVQDGDLAEIDTESGAVRNLTRNRTFHAVPHSKPLQDIMKAGGLIPYVREKIEKLQSRK